MKIHTIENKYIKLDVLDQGATIHRVFLKEKNIDVVRHNTLEYFKNNPEYDGCIVGPSAGRITNQEIIMHGEKIKLPITETCLLHSGADGIQLKVFNVEKISNTKILFRLNTESTLPIFKNQKIEVTYEIIDKQIKLDISSSSNQEVIMNYTNHTYWNLGEKDVNELSLKIPARKMLELDSNQLITGKIIDVPKEYDFSELSLIKNQIKNIDDIFVLDDHKIEMRSENNGITMSMTTNQPCLVVYNAAGSQRKYTGLCLEAQGYSNAINKSHFPSNLSKNKVNTFTWTFKY